MAPHLEVDYGTLDRETNAQEFVTFPVEPVKCTLASSMRPVEPLRHRDVQSLTCRAPEEFKFLHLDATDTKCRSVLPSSEWHILLRRR